MRVITRLDETCREVRDAARVIGDAELFKKMEEAQTKIKRDSKCMACLHVSSEAHVPLQSYSQPACTSRRFTYAPVLLLSHRLARTRHFYPWVTVRTSRTRECSLGNPSNMFYARARQQEIRQRRVNTTRGRPMMVSE